MAHVFLDFGVGGAQRLALDTWRHLDPRRYRPVLICARSEGASAAEARAQGVPVCALGRLHRGWDGPALLLLARTLRASGANIVQTPLYSRVAPYARLAAYWAGLPLTIGHEHSRPRPPGPARRWTDRLLDRLPGQRYLAVSRADAAGLGRQGMAAERIAVVPNGVDLTAFGHEERGAARLALGLPQDRLILLVPARLHPQKRHIDLLAAMSTLALAPPGPMLLCAGDGPLRRPLEALARAAGLSERVRFLGQRADLPRLLAACDLVVLASDVEGMPLALMEAQAAARPVVATDVGGVMEIVQPEVSGFLVPPHQPGALAATLEVLAADPERRDWMGRNARDLALARFGIQRSARLLQRQYDRWLHEIEPGLIAGRRRIGAMAP